MNNNVKIFASILMFCMIFIHIFLYFSGYMGIDQSFPCIVMYIALFGILMSMDTEEEKCQHINEKHIFTIYPDRYVETECIECKERIFKEL